MQWVLVGERDRECDWFDGFRIGVFNEFAVRHVDEATGIAAAGSAKPHDRQRGECNTGGGDGETAAGWFDHDRKTP